MLNCETRFIACGTSEVVLIINFIHASQRVYIMILSPYAKGYSKVKNDSGMYR